MKHSFPKAFITQKDVVETLDFVSSMVRLKPEARISADSAAQHRFINDATNEKRTSPDLHTVPTSPDDNNNNNSADGKLVSFPRDSFLDRCNFKIDSFSSLSLEQFNGFILYARFTDAKIVENVDSVLRNISDFKSVLK